MLSAQFETADAVFVGSPERRVGEPGDPAVYFRTEFEAGPDLLGATLHLTALGTVEPYLNGGRVGDEVLAPGWTSYRHRLLVRSHDLTTMVRTGTNAFGAIVGDGWAVGRLGFEEITRSRIYADRPALLSLIELRYPDRTEYVASGDRFRCGQGSVRANSLYDGVTIDARLEPAGWHEPGFDDGAWLQAEPVAWDTTTLAVATAEPIRRVEELPPRKIWTSPAGSTVVDFGQNIPGWVRLRLDGPRGTEVSVRHAEVLVDGMPDYMTLRTAEATDRYVLAGDGPEEFEPRFTYHGFRYAEIDGLRGELSPDDVRAVVVHSDMTRTGWFETSNDLLNRLHDNVVWSMRGNFVSIPTDCPQRDERLGWTGDINAFAPTATYLYDVREVLMSWLDDLALEQKDFGFVPYVVPDVQPGHDTPTALWSDVAVRLPWQLYWEYGDEEILRRCYDSMATFTRSVVPLLDLTGVWNSGFQFGDWLDPSAPMHRPDQAKADRHLVATAFFHQTAREMARTAQVLGRTEDAAWFSEVADRVRAGFRAEYVSSSGRITGECATVYALAIRFGLLDDNQLRRAGARLADIVRRDGYRISTGFAGTPHVAHALTETGHTDDAYRLLLQTRAPSFLDPVVRGATTIWERWDAILPDNTVNPSGMTSLNHYALGSVAHWMHTVIGGVRATSPGYRTMRIAPRPGGGLTRASAAHDTVHGRVSVEWEREDDTMTVRVTIPDGTTAEVALPEHPARAERTVCAGRHAWTYALATTPAPLTLDSPVECLAMHDAVLASVSGILREYLPPHMDVTKLLDQSMVLPLSVLLNELPGVTDRMRRELTAAIERHHTPSERALLS
ncbi:family 78 glycoside hydrolase catalytic domain [Streptomyces sp. BH097]|uniref:family 78 glycoside hydrolase catalytic domain n=1 Tax=unclassified Streptomyces TaxID=2593676 RepID=UPI003BB51375